MQINIRDAQRRLSRLIKAAQAGEEVVIANRGRPMVRLVPADKESPRPAQGSAEGILDWLRKHPLPDHVRRSAEESDADIEAERKSWD